jgi:hypothetical protein
MNNKKNIKTKLFVALGMIVLIAITGCVDNGDKEKIVYVNNSIDTTPSTPVIPGQEVTASPTPQGIYNSGISSDTGGMMEKYNLDKLTSISDIVVIAEVVDILPSRWNTQNGDKPTVNDVTSYTIYTDVSVKIVESLKGSLSNTADNTIVVRTMGGTVGQDTQNVENQPSYSVNEKVLVFLKNDTDPRTKDVGNKHFVTAGLIQGKVSIPTNDEVIIGDENMSLEEARVIITGQSEKKYGNI